MQPTKLQIDTLTIETFETDPQAPTPQEPGFAIGLGDCTGCVSGCGIFPQEPY
jgi:hypothetical protein